MLGEAIEVLGEHPERLQQGLLGQPGRESARGEREQVGVVVSDRRVHVHRREPDPLQERAREVLREAQLRRDLAVRTRQQADGGAQEQPPDIGQLAPLDRRGDVLECDARRLEREREAGGGHAGVVEPTVGGRPEDAQTHEPLDPVRLDPRARRELGGVHVLRFADAGPPGRTGPRGGSAPSAAPRSRTP